MNVGADTLVFDKEHGDWLVFGMA